MVSSLKDALLQAGLKPTPKAVEERAPRPAHDRNRSAGQSAQGPKGRSAQFNAKGKAQRPDANASRRPKPDGGSRAPKVPSAPKDPNNLSLAEAYKARALAEQREQAEAKRLREAAAAAQRARQAAAEALLDGKALNIAEAEDSRYLEYGRKIRRVYVTPEQNQAITDGVLGIVQMKGRFLVVEAEVARAVRSAAPEFFALLLDGDCDSSGSESELRETAKADDHKGHKGHEGKQSD
jgi:uncharacterized protein YaiL (DUF2058 family)